MVRLSLTNANCGGNEIHRVNYDYQKKVEIIKIKSNEQYLNYLVCKNLSDIILKKRAVTKDIANLAPK